MSFRHVAGLALVGWYLMLPPMGSVESRRNPSTGFYVAYSTQPLNTWEIEESYDTAAECRTAIEQANQLARQSCPECSGVASCIASKDPRLKSQTSGSAGFLGTLLARLSDRLI
jgi:hypothetical protein